MTESLLLYALIFSILVLSGTVILLAGYYLNALKRISLHNKDALRSSETMLNQARQKAHEIIMAASVQARQAVAETKLFQEQASDVSSEISNTLQSIQKEELQKTSEGLRIEYSRAFDELLKEYINMFKSISKDIEVQATLEIKDFKNILRRETLESQKIVGEKIDKLYADTSNEVEDYKKQEIQKIQDNIYKITENAVQLAIGKSIDLDKHEDLILEALKEAVENQPARNATPASNAERSSAGWQSVAGGESK